jgi:hypothetical protein
VENICVEQTRGQLCSQFTVPAWCHLHMEGLPAQTCDPLAMASKGPAHLLPCAGIPKENLKARSSLSNPLQPLLPKVPSHCSHSIFPSLDILKPPTWPFLQPEASFLPSGDQDMLRTQCLCPKKAGGEKRDNIHLYLRYLAVHSTLREPLTNCQIHNNSPKGQEVV